MTNGSNGRPTDDGRGSDGRFSKGNPGGPGCPFVRDVALRRKALLAAITPEDVAAVAKQLLTQALGGDTVAAKVLLSHVCGKPNPAPNPDTLGLEEFLLARRWPSRAEALHVLLDSVDPADVVEMLPHALAGHASAIERVYRGQKPDRTLASDAVKLAAADLAAKGGRGA